MTVSSERRPLTKAQKRQRALVQYPCVVCGDLTWKDAGARFPCCNKIACRAAQKARAARTARHGATIPKLSLWGTH